MFTAKNIIIAIFVIAGILVIINWDKVKKYFSTGSIPADVPYGDLPPSEGEVNKLINEFMLNDSSRSFPSRQAEINSRLNNLGFAIVQYPVGTIPPPPVGITWWWEKHFCCERTVGGVTTTVYCAGANCCKTAGNSCSGATMVLNSNL